MARDPVDALLVIVDRLNMEIVHLEQLHVAAEGGNLSEVYSGAIACLYMSVDEIEAAISYLAPERE